MIKISDEIVFKGNQNNVCDMISDSLVREYMIHDSNSKCNIYVVGVSDYIILSGRVLSNACIDKKKVIDKVLDEVKYSKKYKLLDNINIEKHNIKIRSNFNINKEDAIIYGFACNDNLKYLPTSMVILEELKSEYEKLYMSDNRFGSNGYAKIEGIFNKDLKLIKIENFIINYQTKSKNTDNIIKKICINISNKYNIKIEKFTINQNNKLISNDFSKSRGCSGVNRDIYHGYEELSTIDFSGKDNYSLGKNILYKSRCIALNYLKKLNLRWCSVRINYVKGVNIPIDILVNSDIGKISIPKKLYKECDINSI